MRPEVHVGAVAKLYIFDENILIRRRVMIGGGRAISASAVGLIGLGLYDSDKIC